MKKILFTPLGKRMSKDDINESRGVALIMVMIGMILVSAIGLDMQNDEQMRFRLAVNTRDSVRAQALAQGALNWSRLFITLQTKIQDALTPLLAKGLITLPANTVWDLVSIDNAKLSMLISGQLADLLFPEKKEAEAEAHKSGIMFGNFDGDFSIEVVDEESKISINEFGTTTNQDKKNRIRKMLLNLIISPRYDDIFDTGNFSGKVDRPTLVANIFDWLDWDDLRTDPYEVEDAKWGRMGSGSETEQYQEEGSTKPKNAFVDSLHELRLVKGVDDEIEQAFFDAITIYGEGGKINILSAKDQVIEALMRFCAANPEDPLLENPEFVDTMVKKWKDYGKTGGFVSATGFMTYLESNELKVNRPLCQGSIGDKSINFTLTAKATVNGVTRTLTLVTRIVQNAEEIYYFRNR